MCTQPSNTAQALTMVQAGLSFLADCSGSEALAGLEGAEARLTAARAAVLGRFCAAREFEADGQFGPKPWLRAFTRITKGAAAGAMGWMGRLQAHPQVADALAGELISASWAREICGWTDRLPTALIEDADQILLAAAAGGADLADLAALAWEMIERAAVPDGDGDGFADRALWLDQTLAGAGRLTGDLTPACAAAVSAVMEALSAKAGPEDTRSLPQRRHDALEEACQRLIAAGMVPGRDGQPLHVYAHMDLAHLAAAQAAARAGVAGGSRLEARWSLARAVAGPGAWCPAGPDADAAACDATIIPVITGRIDWTLADELITVALPQWAVAHELVPAHGQPDPNGPAPAHDQASPPDPALAPSPAGDQLPPPDLDPAHDPLPGPADPLGHVSPDPGNPLSPGGPGSLLTPEVRQRLRDLVLQQAAGLLSGPAGLTAALRAQALSHPFTGASQPLDLGTPTPVIPPHLRRAVALRDQHCQFPGCWQPPSACQIHHIKHRAHDGPTALANLALLCRFHHLIAVHRWGWTLTRHPDGTTTATSPEGRTLHGHSPPRQAPAA
jgi:hypothetical protein